MTLHLIKMQPRFSPGHQTSSKLRLLFGKEMLRCRCRSRLLQKC